MNFEPCKIPEGNILIAFSDRNLSVGTLELDPQKELQKHNRPVPESLFQLKGRCMIKLFGDDGTEKEIVLNEGDSIDIPPEKYHIHSNPFDESSLTFWKASGDITDIIDSIRNSSRM